MAPRLVVTVLLAAALVGVAPRLASPKDAPASTPDGKATLAAMTWLGGTWSGSMWGGTFTAYYSTPEGGKILSYSKLEKEGKIAFHEFELFESSGDKLVLRPHPGGKPAASFQLTAASAADKKVTFENPKNDFPTRLVYHRVADDRLVITLDDPHGDTKKVETFDLKRMP